MLLNNTISHSLGALLMQFYIYSEKMRREGRQQDAFSCYLIFFRLPSKLSNWNETASLPQRVSLVSLVASIPSTPLLFFLCFGLSLRFHPQALLKWPQMGVWDQKYAYRPLYTRIWQSFNTNAIRGLTLAWNICFLDSHQF